MQDSVLVAAFNSSRLRKSAADLAPHRPLPPALGPAPRRERAGARRHLPASRGTASGACREGQAAPADAAGGARPQQAPWGPASRTGARSFLTASVGRRRPRHGRRSLSPRLSAVSRGPESSSKLTCAKGCFEERRQEENLCLNTREG